VLSSGIALIALRTGVPPPGAGDRCSVTKANGAARTLSSSLRSTHTLKSATATGRSNVSSGHASSVPIAIRAAHPAPLVRYVVVANMLCGGTHNPFDAREAKVYQSDADIDAVEQLRKAHEVYAPKKLLHTRARMCTDMAGAV
jgi:hypothetical protein